jgi:hypothetical protein
MHLARDYRRWRKWLASDAGRINFERRFRKEQESSFSGEKEAKRLYS